MAAHLRATERLRTIGCSDGTFDPYKPPDQPGYWAVGITLSPMTLLIHPLIGAGASSCIGMHNFQHAHYHMLIHPCAHWNKKDGSGRMCAGVLLQVSPYAPQSLKKA
eukprot:scaffold564_cov19-Tisochrysis_lutea.AAC.7